MLRRNYGICITSMEEIWGPLAYIQRMPHIQAAMGVAQLGQLDTYIAVKRQIAKTYAAALGDMPGITLMQEANWAFSNFWVYTVLIDEAALGNNNHVLLRALQ